MAPAKDKEAIVILLDVGFYVSQSGSDGSPFLDKAKQCASMIIQRKLFASSKDEIGLILFGCEETVNDLADDVGYEHISVASDLELPTWHLLKQVDRVSSSKVQSSDWLDAIVVAIQYLRDQMEGKLFSEQKIVMFSNFACPVSDNQVDTIVRGLQQLDINLIVIGAEITNPGSEEDEPKGKCQAQVEGESLIANIVTKVGGVICSFDDAMPQLMYFQRKNMGKSPRPWNVCLEIGNDIKIPVSGFKMIATVPRVKWLTEYVVDKAAELVNIKKYVQQKQEGEIEIKSEDVIAGYNFGSTIVPFSAIEKATMSYDSGGKCLKLLGFTSIKNVPRHVFMGEGVYYFVAQKDNEPANAALSALLLAMKDTGMAAIVRKVYMARGNVVLGALIPYDNADCRCLVFVELPYAEDEKQFILPPVSRKNPSSEQLDAIDQLIQDMDLLADVEDGEEPFDPEKTLDPAQQHIYHGLAFRVINPGAKLPNEPVKVVKDLLRPPESLENRCKGSLKQIREQFPLVKKEKKIGRRAAADVFAKNGEDGIDIKEEPKVEGLDEIGGQNMEDLFRSTVVEVGTINPEDDFRLLLSRGEPHTEVCHQMQKVIIKLILRSSLNAEDALKPIGALRALRNSCLTRDPGCYNDFLLDVKSTTLERGLKDVWALIVKEKLGLISSVESSDSVIAEKIAEEFLQVESNKTELSPTDDEAMDVEDLSQLGNLIMNSGVSALVTDLSCRDPPNLPIGECRDEDTLAVHSERNVITVQPFNSDGIPVRIQV